MLMMYTNRLGRLIRSTSAELYINSSNSVSVRNLYWTIRPSTNANQHHKNWSPFVYNDTIHYVESLKPFTVSKAVGNVSLDSTRIEAITTLVSISNANFDWPYGQPRGGTPAIWINETVEYLAFFHSSTYLPWHYWKTYLFGAYTFSSSPPFRITSMSVCPIMNEKLYSGGYSAFKNRQIDYVSFPTSFYLQGDTIMLSFGHQDVRGLLGEIKLDNLLKTLKKVG